jgi:uncharacterized LabA/DUF88 family protein
MEDRTAILVDGGFYKMRAHGFFGHKSAEARADELETYCSLHIKDGNGKRSLYRVFYYDCPPIDRFVFHPLTKRNINLGKSSTYTWTNSLFNALKRKRKFALRLGRLSDIGHGYRLNSDAVKKLCDGKISVGDLTESDFILETRQKGVDMRIGLDIAHLAYKRLVSQIILISGDSDFVPAAKLARREGIDFILDPMKSHIADDLLEHVDGVSSHWNDDRIPITK